MQMQMLLLLLCFYLSVFSQVDTTWQRTVNEIECLDDLSLKKFMLSNPGASSKLNWKVVIGREIEYRARPKSGVNWIWLLGDSTETTFGQNWNIKTTTGVSDFTSKSSGSLKAIVDTIYMPSNNSSFGSTYGLLNISNSNIPNGITFTDTVNVFYDKDSLTNPNGNVPNWFYYWSDIDTVMNLLNVSGIAMYDTVTGSFQSTPTSTTFTLRYRDDGNFAWIVPPPGTPIVRVYGSNEASSRLNHASFEILDVDPSNPPCQATGNTFRKVMKDYGSINFIINIGQNCGFQYDAYDYGPGIMPSMGFSPIDYLGIEAFKAVLLHEVEHWILMQEFWVDGYDSVLDCDADFYPDAWEAGPVGAAYGFNNMVPDNYNSNYDAKNLPSFGAATHYEEERVRRKEVSGNTKLLNIFDWSFDYSNLFQGKNWKK